MGRWWAKRERERERESEWERKREREAARWLQVESGPTVRVLPPAVKQGRVFSTSGYPVPATTRRRNTRTALRSFVPADVQ